MLVQVNERIRPIRTQDFLATSHSVTSTVRNARQFIAFIRASRNRLTLPVTLARAAARRGSATSRAKRDASAPGDEFPHMC